MKTIIIATDFSPAAKNAADYAAQLSKITDSSIVLFHAWTIPVMTAESLSVPVSIEELEADTMRVLNAEAKRLKKIWGVAVEVKQKAGFAAEEILNCAQENKAGLVIMGMDHRDKIVRVFGSASTAFLHECKFPTLIIPENLSYSRPRVFLFATDLQTKNEWKEFDVLAELASKFHAGIHILNAVQEPQLANVNESELGIKLEARLKEFPHSWHFPNDGDVAHAISKTAKDVSADWIAVVPHKLSWFKQLFHHSISNELVFTANYPILALPEIV